MFSARATRLLAVAIAAVGGALTGAPSALAWSWPADGPVLREFVLGENEYAGGQHRGVDIAVGGTRAILAPVAGEVTFAGQVPTHGLTVTIATPDGYKASLTHVGSLLVKRGAQVGEGDPVAEPGPSGEAEHETPYVHLGVRVGQDEKYVDPLGLLPVRAVSPPPVVAPPPAPAPSPAPAPQPAPTPSPAPVPAAGAPISGPAPPTPATAPAPAPAASPVPDPPTAEASPSQPSVSDRAPDASKADLSSRSSARTRDRSGATRSPAGGIRSANAPATSAAFVAGEAASVTASPPESVARRVPATTPADGSSKPPASSGRAATTSETRSAAVRPHAARAPDPTAASTRGVPGYGRAAEPTAPVGDGSADMEVARRTRLSHAARSGRGERALTRPSARAETREATTYH